MSRLFLVLTIVATLGAVTTIPVAIAQPEPPGIRVAGSGTDADADGLDDGLAGALEAAAPSDRFDVIVTHRGRADEAGARRAVGPFATRARFSIVPGYAATMSAAQIRGLSRTPGIFRIEPDSLVSTTNDSANDDFGTATARASYGVDGNGAGICIVDTGVDPGHEQLDNGKVVGFVDFVNGQPNAYDDNGHGTHVAATAAGDGVGPSPDAAAFAGVAPGATIYSAKVLNQVGSGLESDVVLGIEWCVAQPGVDIVSLSLGVAEGSDGADAMSQAVDNAVLVSNRAVTVAAGNSGDGTGSILAPGAAAHAITAGAAAEHSADEGTERHSNGIHLAGFSSRGPTAAGLIKPDIIAPGVTITSAQHNTTGGYVTFSGTSMAAPFVAGTLALALERNPSLTPAQLKQLVTGTAQDRGKPGMDVNWGAGLLDGMAVVSSANGDPAVPTAFPDNEYGTGSVNPNGTFTHDFVLGPEDLTTPIGITVLIDGQAECVLIFGIFCSGIYEWDPDLDAELLDPTGAVIARSLCPGDPSGHCGTLYVTQGQQETLAAMPTVAGTYQLRVTPVQLGGSFRFDISAGAPDGTPPPNAPPTADAGPDQTVSDADENGSESVTLDGTGSSDSDGTIVSYVWTDDGGATIPDGPTPTADFAVGTHNVTLTVTDDSGDSDTDVVVITVDPAPPNVPPTADAGPDQTVTDADENGSESVTLDGTGSSDSDGSIVSYVWTDVGTGDVLASGALASIDLGVGDHFIRLTVTDDDGDTGEDITAVSVVPPLVVDTMHVHDLDGASSAVGRNRWQATVTVYVVGTTLEDLGFPIGVDPSTVTFGLSTGGTVQCTTQAGGGLDGLCTVVTPTLKKGDKTVTLTVQSVVTPGFDYEPSRNHDGDGDSDGTQITISRP